jgi:hypothetical protein
MPLLVATLQAEILKITDQNDPNFVGPSLVIAGGVVDMVASNDLAATFWANAVGAYLSGIIVPPGAVAMVPAAVAAFKTAFFPLLGVPGGALIALNEAFMKAAIVLAAAPPPAAIPPPVPLLTTLAPAMAPFAAGTFDPHPPAAAMALAIDTWFRTGLWGPPPAPPASLWS